MLDRDKDIRAQGQLKSIWEGLNHSLTDDPVQILDRVELYLKASLQFIEAYAKIETPEPWKLQEPPKSTGNSHLSDEMVAKGLDKDFVETVGKSTQNWPEPQHITLKNGERVLFATEPQHKRAYAIAMGHGWDQKSLKNFLFKSYGISDNRKGLYACFYDEIINRLKAGPMTEAQRQIHDSVGP